MALYVLVNRGNATKTKERLPLENVEAFFADSKYVMARSTDGKEGFVEGLIDPNGLTTDSHHTLSLRQINQWLEATGQTQFIRVHRGWLVNLNHAKTYRNSQEKGVSASISTYSGCTADVSRRYRTNTKRAFVTGVTGMIRTVGTLAVAALAAMGGNTQAADISYTDSYPATDACTELASPLQADATTTRILCDCEPDNAMCWSWDTSGMITGQERETDHATRKGLLTLQGLQAVHYLLTGLKP